MPTRLTHTQYLESLPRITRFLQQHAAALDIQQCPELKTQASLLELEGCVVSHIVDYCKLCNRDRDDLLSDPSNSNMPTEEAGLMGAYISAMRRLHSKQRTASMLISSKDKLILRIAYGIIWKYCNFSMDDGPVFEATSAVERMHINTTLDRLWPSIREFVAVEDVPASRRG